MFHAPYAHYGEFYGAIEGFERHIQDTILHLFGGKSMLIYAMLFGVGFYMQSHRSSAAVFRTYWYRRMLILAIFGIVHILFFWFGDILLPYAALGLLLPFIINLNSRAQLILAALLFFAPAIYAFGMLLFNWPNVGTRSEIDLNTFINTFSNGSFNEIFELRMHEYFSFRNEKLLMYIPKELAAFILGYQLAKNDFVGVIQSKLKVVWVIVIPILLVLWYVYQSQFFGLFDLAAHPYLRPPLLFLIYVMEMLHALTWVSIIIFLFKFKLGNWLLSALAKPGRVSLTNYIMQSLFCILIFYGFGLGMYGSLKPSELLMLTIGIYLFEFAFSSWWLKRFKQGPLEKLWRNLSNKEKLIDQAI